MKNLISYLFKLIVVFASFLGIYLCISLSGEKFMGGTTTLMYFTIQSNIWIGIVCFIAIILMSLEFILKKHIIKRWMKVVKYVFTISITLTGFVFCFILAPAMKDAWNLPNILTHVVVPIFSIIDFFIFDTNVLYKNKDVLFATLPPTCYFIFTVFAYILNLDFGGGNNFPYFFLYWDSPAGAFGFSKVVPYFMGTVYWIILIIAFVLSLSFLYKYLANKKYNKNI